MKKISLYFLAFTAAIFTGCESDDKVVDYVLENVTSSAILRTRTLEGAPYNAFVPESALTIVVEAQNGRPDTEITSVDLYLSFTDNQDDDTDNSVAEQLVKTFDPSEFTAGSRDLPEITYNTTLEESATALGLTEVDYTGGDVFTYRYVINLSDGTTWTNVNGNGNITGGSYFASPYAYNVSVSCIPIDPVPGDYTLDMQDSYGDGWNGASVRVTLDGVATDYTITTGAAGSATISIPDTATEWFWEYVSGDWDSEVTFSITAPNGEVAFSDGPSPNIGEIILNICPE